MPDEHLSSLVKPGSWGPWCKWGGGNASCNLFITTGEQGLQVGKLNRLMKRQLLECILHREPLSFATCEKSNMKLILQDHFCLKSLHRKNQYQESKATQNSTKCLFDQFLKAILRFDYKSVLYLCDQSCRTKSQNEWSQKNIFVPWFVGCVGPEYGHGLFCAQLLHWWKTSLLENCHLPILRESSHSGSSSVTVITKTSVRCFCSQFCKKGNKLV